MNDPLYVNGLKTVFILGAGFSCGLGLPSQEKIPRLLLSSKFQEPVDIIITEILASFLRDIFNNDSKNCLPSLEDIFTFIDLSAGSGHNLGINYPPKRLRAVRRFLIHRILRILDYRYDDSRNPRAIQNFLESISGISENSPSFSFIVLNWDIVLEKQLFIRLVNAPIDYCCDCTNYDRLIDKGTQQRIRICKMHGSGNWVYCYNCKNLYYREVDKIALTSGADLNKSDFELFPQQLLNLGVTLSDEMLKLPHPFKCKNCGNSLSFHIATFSYRKSFHNPAYSSIWYAAEKLLSNASNWVFIGYSLPEADYELKTLLKSAQLQKPDPKRIIVIDPKKAVHKKYRCFFGNTIESYINKYQESSILQIIKSLS
jgi:hypothetical protein